MFIEVEDQRIPVPPYFKNGKALNIGLTASG